MHKPRPVQDRLAPPPIPSDDRLTQYKKRRRKTPTGLIAGFVFALLSLGALVGCMVWLSAQEPGQTGVALPSIADPDMWAVNSWFANHESNPDFETVKKYPTVYLNDGHALRLKYRQQAALGPVLRDRVFFVAGGQVIGWYDDHERDAPIAQADLEQFCTMLAQLGDGAKFYKLEGKAKHYIDKAWMIYHTRKGRIQDDQLQTVRARTKTAHELMQFIQAGQTVTLTKTKL